MTNAPDLAVLEDASATIIVSGDAVLDILASIEARLGPEVSALD